jgi:glyceraldehyde-3-phosphate dehydrogenase (NADP+)
MKICSEEIFGPVVTIEPVQDDDEGIAMLNNTRFGLQAGFYTDNIQVLWKAFDQLQVGGIIHNDVPTFRADMMPYGGIRDSGLGREGIKYAMRDMLEPRILVINRNS